MFGIFKFVAKYGDYKEDMMFKIAHEFILNDWEYDSLIAMNKTDLATTKTDEKLKWFAKNWRDHDREARKTSRVTYFTNKYIVHECDENGHFIPTKKELAEAQEWVKKFI